EHRYLLSFPTRRSSDLNLEEMNFNNLGIIDPIIKAVNDIGYSAATQIQKQVIPLILKGQDIIGCAQTGTGKTAAFALPVLQLLRSEEHTSELQSRENLV